MKISAQKKWREKSSLILNLNLAIVSSAERRGKRSRSRFQFHWTYSIYYMEVWRETDFRTCSEIIPAYSRNLTISIGNAWQYSEFCLRFLMSNETACYHATLWEWRTKCSNSRNSCLPEDTIFSNVARVGYFVSSNVK